MNERQNGNFNDNATDDLGDFADLESMFGLDDQDLHKAESVVLTQNLEGFASCFPDWDLHPPVDM